MSIPQYGGVDGAAELDLGQTGSARAASGDAQYVVKVSESPDVARNVTQRSAQQNFVATDVLGFVSGQVIWEGTLKIKDAAVYRQIISHLDKFQHGSDRSSGSLGPVDLSYLQPTKLTDGLAGGTITTRARMVGWVFTSDVQRLSGSSSFQYIVGLTVIFNRLG